jgi:hypothetical protein
MQTSASSGGKSRECKVCGVAFVSALLIASAENEWVQTTRVKSSLVPTRASRTHWKFLVHEHIFGLGLINSRSFKLDFCSVYQDQLRNKFILSYVFSSLFANKEKLFPVIDVCYENSHLEFNGMN